MFGRRRRCKCVSHRSNPAILPSTSHFYAHATHIYHNIDNIFNMYTYTQWFCNPSSPKTKTNSETKRFHKTRFFKGQRTKFSSKSYKGSTGLCCHHSGRRVGLVGIVETYLTSFPLTLLYIAPGTRPTKLTKYYSESQKGREGAFTSYKIYSALYFETCIW